MAKKRKTAAQRWREKYRTASHVVHLFASMESDIRRVAEEEAENVYDNRA